MRNTVSLLLLLVPILLSAKHLEFMGIPLDGTISNFQTKLQAKGFTPYKADNIVNIKPAHPALGVRTYKGQFAGEKCILAVYFLSADGTVYQAVPKIYTETGSLKKALVLFNKLGKLLYQKYKREFGIRRKAARPRYKVTAYWAAHRVA